MRSVHDIRGRIVGGILDLANDQTYYTLQPCPRHGDEVQFHHHLDCEHYEGLIEDPGSGTHLLVCGDPERLRRN